MNQEDLKQKKLFKNPLKKPMYYILDENNIPVPTEDLLVWESFIRDTSKRVVSKTTTKDNHYVSTVFLGLDHSWVEGVVLLFETMIFSEDKDVDEYQERYSTWQEAEEGHDKIVAELEAGTFAGMRKTLTLHLNKPNKDAGI